MYSAARCHTLRLSCLRWVFASAHMSPLRHTSWMTTPVCSVWLFRGTIGLKCIFEPYCQQQSCLEPEGIMLAARCCMPRSSVLHFILCRLAACRQFERMSMQQILWLYRNCLLAFACAFAGAAAHSNDSAKGTRQPVTEHCHCLCLHERCLVLPFLLLML